MKKVINGKRYNTDSAAKVAEWGNGYGVNDFKHATEELYKKKTGEYFLYGQGNGLSEYKGSYGDSWGWGEKIIPLTIKEAQKWAEEKLDGDEYEAIFEISEEGNMQFGLLLPESLHGKIKDDAESQSITMKDVIVEILNAHYKGENEMKKQADKIVDAIKCGMHLYGTTEGLTIKEVAKRNEVEVNQVIEFLGYEGEGFVVDENYNITGFQEYGYEVINGDMIYIITPDAKELTADQITSVTTGFGGQGYNIDFSIKGLNADLYIDTDYYEWYDGEEVDEEFVKVNFSKIMEEVENKEIKWSI